MSEAGGGGLAGHLRLVAARDARDRTVLREQSFRAPFHLSKPYETANALVANIVCPTAGLLAGDRLTTEVSVECGAALVLTTPAASRIHTMRSGIAHSEQRFCVAAEGWLEVWPELLIPQRGARYWQQTRFEVEKGGTLLAFETLAPGRVAHGECFAFDWTKWETDVVYNGRVTARERYRVDPRDESVRALRAVFPAAYYGAAWIVTDALAPSHECWRQIHALHGAECWIASSSLQAGGFVVKLLAADSVTLRRTLAEVRAMLYTALGREKPEIRR